MADGISWVPLYSALAGGVLTGGVALLVSKLNHHYTLDREAKAAAEKRQAELYFISTELVFRLERFAQGCADVVNDEGQEDEQGYTRTTTSAESFSSDDIAGDWRVLPATILYRIRELTVLIPEANRYIRVINEWDNPPDWQMTFRERRYQYSRLGMRAVLLAKRLRRLNHMPSSRLDASRWSAQHVLWQQWRKERKFRARMAREVPDFDL
ncbi:hypothetical protein [Buttiauxella agrestis]|uniref:Uncharacterized protein n=1 Tax=Buttiauxella agrestis ATCC 33320 TaxID=1006004 RepID=A0A085FYZ5_9ENTR|nr:hypothetical protein [Buttiauxella agrestis]KFC76690.1 hypothetical protein GBAG_4325 [Buttiauxella agrestis ATCC 33320]